MARRSLRPQLNQIRTWVRQGRTDAWIAHQLEVTTQQIASFKRENKLTADEAEPETAGAVADFDDEIDLRAEDDALIAAELEAAQAAKEKAEAEAAKAKAKADAARAKARRAVLAAGEADEDEDEDEDKPARRRGRRGGRSRRKAAGPLEGTFDHGEEGYGLWLDPAVQDDPVYAEHWAGHRPVEITIDEDQIVIKRLDGV
jgi:membrane protein involved in colicin uptake